MSARPAEVPAGDVIAIHQQPIVAGAAVRWRVRKPGGGHDFRDATCQVHIAGHALIVPSFRLEGEPAALWVAERHVLPPHGPAPRRLA